MELTEKIAVKGQSGKPHSHSQSDLPHGHHEVITPPFVSTILVIVLFPNQPQTDSVKIKASCLSLPKLILFKQGIISSVGGQVGSAKRGS